MLEYGSHNLQDPLLEPIKAPKHAMWSFITNFSMKESEVNSVHELKNKTYLLFTESHRTIRNAELT